MGNIERTIITGRVNGFPPSPTYDGQFCISVKSSFHSEHSSREGKAGAPAQRVVVLPEEGAIRVPVNE